MSQLNEVIKTAIDSLRSVVDANTIIGEEIKTESGVSIIPVSKISLGFAAGGIDYTAKKADPAQKNNFGGGNGAGLTVNPVCFLVVSKDGNVTLLNAGASQASSSDPLGSINSFVDNAPALIEKIKAFFPKKAKKGAAETTADKSDDIVAEDAVDDCKDDE